MYEPRTLVGKNGKGARERGKELMLPLFLVTLCVKSSSDLLNRVRTRTRNKNSIHFLSFPQIYHS